MRTTLLFAVLVAGSILPPALSSSQSGSSEVMSVAKSSYSSTGEPGASPEPSPTPAAAQSSRWRMGAGVRLSSLGIGGEVAVALTRRTNIRGGFNAFSYNRNFTYDTILYGGTLRLQSAEAHYDWYPLGWGFHLSPGIMAYNGNKLSGSAGVPGGSTFTLNGSQYVSDPSDPVAGTGKIGLNSYAPTLMLGFGNLVRRTGRRLAINFEVGVAYHGTPQATLNLGGGICSPEGLGCETISSDPDALANVAAEQAKINHNISAYKVYPVISLGIGYRFR